IIFGVLSGLMNGVLILVLKSVFTVVLPNKEERDTPEAFQPFEGLPYLEKIEFARPDLPPEKEWIFVAIICMIVPIMLLLRGLFTYIHQYFMLWINTKILFRMRDECFGNLMRQSLSYFNRKKQGELMHTVATQTRMSAEAGTQMMSAWIKHPIAILAIFGLLLKENWVFTMGAIIVFPLCILPVASIARKVRKSGGREEQESEDLNVTMQESFAGIRLVKANSREEYQRERFNEGSKRLNRFLMRWRKAMEISTPLVEVVASFGICFGLVYAWMTKMETASFLILIMGFVSIYPHAKTLSRIHVQLQRCGMAATRVFQLIDSKPDVEDAPNATELTDADATGPLALNNVQFAYEPDNPVLRGVSLDFEPGKKYALVGQSGSGKSTILSLMMRFYDPESGSITINGKDIREFTQESLRDEIGLVSQETFLFHDTIRANIRYGLLDATDAQIEEAARIAHAHEFIVDQPDGYDTILGDKGCTLSGGQQQRLSIARAMLRNAPILFLDEAMSALDTESEKIVQEAIDTLSEGKTVIAIAHRLSTILDSDAIVVMKNGKVEAMGPHAEILETCQEYKRLYELQFNAAS
ncbi:MAG: ABC transporter ATP-binding protein, partial [Verrucomicrobiota bacterium]